LGYPFDVHAWKDFDKKYSNVAHDPQNLRLCLSSNGFNPFGDMNIQYNIWPVIVMTYNFPL